MEATVSIKTQIKDLTDKLDAKRTELHGIFAEAGPELDMSKVSSIAGDSKAKVAHIQQLNSELEEVAKELAGLKGLERAVDNAKELSKEDGSENGKQETKAQEKRERKSIGELFAESPALKGYQFGQGVGPVAHLDVDLKTLMTTSAGWDPQDIRIDRVELFPTRPAPHVVDFIPEFPTSQSAIVYMEETTFTNNAAETAEAGTYGEAALALTQRTQPVEKIAVWLPVTDEQLEDVPGASAYINQRLAFMVRQRLDSQALVGNGTPPNLLGTENVTGIQTQALGGDVIPDAIYKVARKIRDNGFAEPSVVFIAPSKWETVRLLRTVDGIYIWGHPSTPGPEQIWGIPVVQTTAVTSTKAVVGDYANFAGLFTRRGLDVQVTNSHSTFFVEGKQAIRADLRLSLVHFRPKAFGAVTGL
jgi:hypothetical protein